VRPVSKFHGARNDFIIVDARRQRLDDVVAFARRWCDRRTGIGADGLLVIGPSDRTLVSMRVINADGSEAEMCGNGVRCVARYLDERGEESRLEVDTLGGIVRTEVLERGEVYRVRVDVGEPRILWNEGNDARVDVGNPHLVLFRDAIETVDLVALGRDHPDLNVHVAAVETPSALRVRHFERGAGLTMACGTGAVASAVAAIVRGGVHSPVEVRVPGGELTIEWNGNGHAFMTGPAVHVFDTQI